MQTVRSPYHELELSHVPERRSVVQARKNVPHAGSRIAILKPTQLNDAPQFVVESELFRRLGFVRSDPLCNRMDS